jgi:protein involved in temperature-dependent protein secretion
MDSTIEHLLQEGNLTAALTQAETALAEKPDDGTLHFLMFELRL